MPAVGPLFSPAVGPLFLASFHQDHPSVHVYSGCCLELCSLSPASLFCECVSLAPRAPYTPSFAVWCLGLSRACALLLRSSWHSMSRSRTPSSWHSMALQRRFPTSCSPVHVLTHVFSFARFTCCAWSGVTQHHSLPSPPRAARVEGVVSRLVVNSAMPCLWPLLCVAGNTSSLEPVPRRSAHCAFRRALLCSVSRDRPRWSFFPSRPCAGGHPMSPLCTSLL